MHWTYRLSNDLLKLSSMNETVTNLSSGKALYSRHDNINTSGRNIRRVGVMTRVFVKTKLAGSGKVTAAFTPWKDNNVTTSYILADTSIIAINCQLRQIKHLKLIMRDAMLMYFVNWFQ